MIENKIYRIKLYNSTNVNVQNKNDINFKFLRFI